MTKRHQRELDSLIHDTNAAVCRIDLMQQKLSEWLRENKETLKGIKNLSVPYIVIEYLKSDEKAVQKAVDNYRAFLKENPVEIPDSSEGNDLNSIAYNVAINWNHTELGSPTPFSRQLTTGLQQALDKLVKYFKK